MQLIISSNFILFETDHGGQGGKEDYHAAQGPAHRGVVHCGVNCCTSDLSLYTLLFPVAVHLSQVCTA